VYTKLQLEVAGRILFTLEYGLCFSTLSMILQSLTVAKKCVVRNSADSGLHDTW
jgi:hypothetical protein